MKLHRNAATAAASRASGPGLAMLRQDLDAASLGGLDVWISLVTVSYQPLPK